MTATGAPLVVEDKVIVGIGGAEYGVRGYLKAYDAADRRAALADLHHPRPGRARQRDLAGRHLDARRRHAPGRPAPTTPRPTRSTGAPAIPAPGTPTCARATTSGARSLLALDPDTGEIKWGYQYTPNDAWDYDGNNAPILIDVRDRRPAGQGGGPVQPQRLLLRARPQQRRVHLRRADRSRASTGPPASTRRTGGRRSTRRCGR